MARISFSINENATVQHIIEQCQTASLLVGQQYCIWIFDLAVAKKAYSHVWQPEFKNVVERMGIFHTICSIFGTLGGKTRGSRLAEIVVVVKVCTSGSLDKVMSGIYFNRELRAHKVMFDMTTLEQAASDLFPDVLQNPSHEAQRRRSSQTYK